MGANGVTFNRANRISRVFGDQSLQGNFLTTNLQMRSVNAAASYPLLKRSTDANGIKTFNTDTVILLGAYLSTTFFTANAAETACVSILRNFVDQINALGDTNDFLHQTLDSKVGVTANQVIQRNTGTMFSPPFFPIIKAGQSIALFGSDNPNVSWYCHAKIFYLRATDLELMQQLANG